VGAHPPRLLSQVVDGQGQVIITATKIFRLEKRSSVSSNKVSARRNIVPAIHIKCNPLKFFVSELGKKENERVRTVDKN
jgi:hypothetical protein